MTNKTIRVTILDDHQSTVDGHTYRLGKSPQTEVVATISFGEDLEPTLTEHPTDVLLLDVNVPTSRENPNPYPILNVIPELLQKFSNLRILVISMHAERGLIRAVMQAGASGYILKDDQATILDLGNVVASVASGGIHLSRQATDFLLRGSPPELEKPLSRRELEVLSLCLSYPDKTEAELAQTMNVANSTVRNLLSGAYLKLDVRSRHAAVAKARQLGLITPEPPTVPSHRN
jgi:DNA-binding NarL/FixJ family response regulator